MSHVYLFTSRHWQKVGRSTRPAKRLMEVSNEHRIKFKVGGTWHRPEDAIAVEYLTRRYLWGSQRQGTHELFKVSPDDALAAVLRAIEFCDAGDWSSYRKDQLPPSLKHLAPYRPPWWVKWMARQAGR